ncbi:MAG: TetR/AcrR family transcriptional regulator [Bacilli bacterium]|nr:TetR/AcrR family transcriptional regulator [Bacilli bacterium]
MDKRKQIIEKARFLFQNYGYKKVSMDEIAREAEVTKKTIYSYFKDKDALFGYFIEEEREQMKQIIEQIEKKNLSFFDTVHETIYALLKYHNQSPFFKTLHQEAKLLAVSPALGYLKETEKDTENYIKRKLTEAMQKKQIKTCNADLCAFIILKVYKALLIEWDCTNHPLSEKEVTDNITAVLKTGLFNEGGNI